MESLNILLSFSDLVLFLHKLCLLCVNISIGVYVTTLMKDSPLMKSKLAMRQKLAAVFSHCESKITRRAGEGSCFLKPTPYCRRKGPRRVKNDLSTHKNTDPHQWEENILSFRIIHPSSPLTTPVCVNNPNRTGQLVYVMWAMRGFILQAEGARCSYQEPSRLRPLWGKVL